MSNKRRVLITGANKGIGLAIVTAVLEAGNDTFVVLGARSKERGQAARDQLVADDPARAERIDVVQLDVADDASVTAAAARGDPCPPRATMTVYRGMPRHQPRWRQPQRSIGVTTWS